MSEIPDDVMKAAQAVVLWAYSVPPDEAEHIKNVAIAILAERERCAKVAEARFTKDNVIKTAKGEPYITGSAAIYAAGQIASAIRKGTTS